MSSLSASGQIPTDVVLSYNIPANLGGGGGSSNIIVQVLPVGSYLFTVSLNITENAAGTITTGALVALVDGVTIASNTFKTPTGTYNPKPFLSGIFVSDGYTPITIEASGAPYGGGGWTSAQSKLYVIRIL